MDKITILEEIRESREILSLPQVLSKILEEVGKEDFSAENLSKIILQDPSLTGNILKLANSSFYQRVVEIKTVNQAVAILGVTTVKCLALSTSIFHPEKIAEESGIEAKEFFTYVLSIAAASEKLARKVGYKAPEEATIAGLLCDLGMMYFIHHHPHEYRKVLKFTAGGMAIVDAEIKVFGIDHCEVGYNLASNWKLPEYIVKAIRDHHKATNVAGDEDLVNIVRLAVQLTTDNFSGALVSISDRMSKIHSLTSALGLDKSEVDEVSFSMLSGSIEMADYLGLDIGDHEEMLVKANREIWQSYITIENLFKERQELSQKLLKEEHDRGMVESKNIAMATLSHYVNNAAMAVYGRSQIMRMLAERGNLEKLQKQVPVSLEVIDKAIMKIVAVLEEMREISPIDDVEFFNVSRSLNIDDRLKKRLESMDEDDKWHAQKFDTVSDMYNS